MCTWLALTWWKDGKPSLVGALTGAIAGLACVTPCAGYIPTWAAFVVGLLAGSVCHYAVIFKDKMQWDDALDVWAARGLIAGNWTFFGWQVLATVVIAAYAFVATFLILKLIGLFGSIRVPDAAELKGLDESEFGEAAYNLT
jgi:Amt family ammonium transporter